MRYREPQPSCGFARRQCTRLRGSDRKGVSISEVSLPPTGATESGSASEFPDGPWILVVGMHRSGTSALTGMLGGLGLGLPQPDDQWDPLPSNPEHFESMSSVLFDDRLLEFLGGSWDGPPDLPAGWEHRLDVQAFDDEARRAARRAFPDGGPVVWKDPRSCLLLPYWRRLIPETWAAVLMWRSPTEVARSLYQRDGLSWAVGTALWEHYNRAALGALEGTQVYVTSYDELLVDPVGLCGALGAWLDSLDALAARRGTWDVEGGTAGVQEALRHQRLEEDEPLLDSQRDLLERLRQLHGPHQSLPAAGLAPPSPWGSAVLEEHRKAVVLSREVEAREESRLVSEDIIEQLEASAAQSYRTVQAMRTTTSWRLTQPFRSLSAGRHRRHGGR